MHWLINILTFLFRKKPKPKEREWMLWIGNDQQHTTPEWAIGAPVDFHGRKGKVIEKTDMTILIEWND